MPRAQPTPAQHPHLKIFGRLPTNAIKSRNASINVSEPARFTGYAQCILLLRSTKPMAVHSTAQRRDFEFANHSHGDHIKELEPRYIHWRLARKLVLLLRHLKSLDACRDFTVQFDASEPSRLAQLRQMRPSKCRVPVHSRGKLRRLPRTWHLHLVSANYIHARSSRIQRNVSTRLVRAIHRKL